MCESYRAVVNSLRKRVPWWTTSPPAAPPHLPCEVFLQISRYLQYEDYRNLIEAFWPAGGEDEPDKLIRQRLWKMSTRSYSTSFFNGKPLQVEYNYDAKRPLRSVVLLNMKTLVPITGPIFPTDTDELWMSPSEIIRILRIHYDMDTCSEYRYANCDCCERQQKTVQYPETFAELCGTDCPHGHFHHYCVHHISWWLQSYLRTSIQLQEAKPAPPQPLPARDNTFVNMLMRCWCIPAGAESAVVSDIFISTTAVNDTGNSANS